MTDLTKAGSAVLLVSHNLHMLQSLPIDKVYVAQNGMITKKGGMELITKIAQDGF